MHAGNALCARDGGPSPVCHRREAGTRGNNREEGSGQRVEGGEILRHASRAIAFTLCPLPSALFPLLPLLDRPGAAYPER